MFAARSYSSLGLQLYVNKRARAAHGRRTPRSNQRRSCILPRQQQDYTFLIGCARDKGWYSFAQVTIRPSSFSQYLTLTLHRFKQLVYHLYAINDDDTDDVMCLAKLDRLIKIKQAYSCYFPCGLQQSIQPTSHPWFILPTFTFVVYKPIRFNSYEVSRLQFKNLQTN